MNRAQNRTVLERNRHMTVNQACEALGITREQLRTLTGEEFAEVVTWQWEASVNEPQIALTAQAFTVVMRHARAELRPSR